MFFRMLQWQNKKWLPMKTIPLSSMVTLNKHPQPVLSSKEQFAWNYNMLIMKKIGPSNN